MADEKKIAPDRISDVAEWGDREPTDKRFADMTDEELQRAEQARAQLPPLPMK